MTGTLDSYSDLQAQIQRFLLKAATDLIATPDQIKLWIYLCETELNRELRVRELQETFPIVTVANQSWVDLPSDYKRIDTFQFDSAPFPIEYRTKQALAEDYGGRIERPKAFTIFGSKIYFGPTPDAVYNLTLDYFTGISRLADYNTVNSILDEYPDVYLYGSLKQAQMQLGDATKAQMWGSNYNAIIDRISLADEKSKVPSGRMRMRPRNPIGGR